MIRLQIKPQSYSPSVDIKAIFKEMQAAELKNPPFLAFSGSLYREPQF